MDSSLPHIRFTGSVFQSLIPQEFGSDDPPINVQIQVKNNLNP